MKILPVVLCLTSCLIVALEGRRVKRDLFQLAEQIVDVTGRDPLKFNGYGCYCGWGGSGTPVDEDDKCCQQHDDCYGSVTSEIPGCKPKWNHYQWDIKGKTVDCLDQASNIKSALLFKSTQSCPKRICECDKALVECLYKNKYHEQNYGLNKNLRCKDNKNNIQM